MTSRILLLELVSFLCFCRVVLPSIAFPISSGYIAGTHSKSFKESAELSQSRPQTSILCKVRQLARLPRRHSTTLHYSRREDNLFSGLAEIGMGFSVGVLWSEYSIIGTGCGPLGFSDTLERICYQGVIVLSGIALFNRIVTTKSLETTVDELFGPLLDVTLLQVRIAEYASALAVVGAIAALAVQYQSGANMSGLSGIDESLCRAIRDL